MIKVNSEEEFNEYSKENAVFMFSANWCPDCRFIEPFMPSIESEFPQFKFVYVDRDKFINKCIENNVLGIPSFIVYKDGKVVGTFISKFRKTKQEIVDFLNSVK
ncbi:MAG: trxA 5 [Haloplasmataceae bacterium]|jgi:thiol-disulfide isomerase/thioredoxin|nr:trxA 5 [Haloplasmataceae bacterium]